MDKRKRTINQKRKPSQAKAMPPPPREMSDQEKRHAFFDKCFIDIIATLYNVSAVVKKHEQLPDEICALIEKNQMTAEEERQTRAILYTMIEKNVTNKKYFIQMLLEAQKKRQIMQDLEIGIHWFNRKVAIINTF